MPPSPSRRRLAQMKQNTASVFIAAGARSRKTGVDTRIAWTRTEEASRAFGNSFPVRVFKFFADPVPYSCLRTWPGCK